MTDATIIVFTRAPVVGAVKTRLFSVLEPKAACLLQAACLADTLRLASRLTASRRLLYITGKGSAWHQAWSFSVMRSPRLRHQWQIEVQHGRNLGARMRNAIADCFRAGASKVVLIGTDTPWMSAARLRRAFRALDKADVVIGPARDAGYYLVGARAGLSGEPPRIFSGIDWGTRRVLRQTVEKLRRARISYHLLPCDFDLDRPADLTDAEKLLRRAPHRARHLSRWLKNWRDDRP